MTDMLSLDQEHVDVHPLSIDLPPWTEKSPRSPDQAFKIGYFARIAPEKGLHVLADAFIELASRPGHDRCELHAAGWLGDHNRNYLRDVCVKLESAGLADRFTYHGSPDRQDKFDLIRSWDVLSVPTPYADPKGLFLLESLAVGTPVIQPDHGAFGELIRDTGGGKLVPAGDVGALADAICQCHQKPTMLAEMTRGIAEHLRERHSIEVAAAKLRDVCGPSTDQIHGETNTRIN